MVAWFTALRYNFSRINKKNQDKTSPTTNKVNQTLEDFTKKLDNLKEQKIFTQATSSKESASNTNIEEAERSTIAYPSSSAEVQELEQEY